MIRRNLNLYCGLIICLISFSSCSFEWGYDISKHDQSNKSQEDNPGKDENDSDSLEGEDGTLYKYSVSLNSVVLHDSSYASEDNVIYPRHGFLNSITGDTIETSVSHYDVLMQNYSTTPLQNGDVACVKKFKKIDEVETESEVCQTYSNPTAITISAADEEINAYAILTSNATTGETTINVDYTGYWSAGDKLMIIQMQNGDTGSPVAVEGQFEILTVASKGISTLTTTTPLTKTYEVGNYNNPNSSTVQVVTVPQYNGDVIIEDGASITAQPWGGRWGGVIAFETTGQVIMNGTARIDADGLGFRGGNGGVNLPGSRGSGGYQGEGEKGTGAINKSANSLGGGGGSGDDNPSPGAYAGGSGGSFTSALNNSQFYFISPTYKADPGNAFTFNASTSDNLLLGGGGGGGGSDGANGHTGGNGGNGGGIIYIVADSIIQNGTSEISARGQASGEMGNTSGAAGGKGGAGSIYLNAGSIHLNQRGVVAKSDRIESVFSGASWMYTCQNNSEVIYNCPGEGGTGLIKLVTGFLAGSTYPAPVHVEKYQRTQSYSRSCEEIKSDDPGSLSGVYTIDPGIKGAQNIQTVYCDMSGAGEMLAYQNSSNQYVPVSCKAKLNLAAQYNGCAGSCSDGNYTIDPDAYGSYAESTVFCDMSTDGGGWTLVSFLSASIPVGADAIFNQPVGSYRTDMLDLGAHYSLGINHLIQDTESMIFFNETDSLDADSGNMNLFFRYDGKRNPFNYGPTPCFEGGYELEVKTSIADSYVMDAVLERCRDDRFSIREPGNMSETYFYLQNSASGVYWGEAADGFNTFGNSLFWYIR